MSKLFKKIKSKLKKDDKVRNDSLQDVTTSAMGGRAMSETENFDLGSLQKHRKDNKLNTTRAPR